MAKVFSSFLSCVLCSDFSLGCFNRGDLISFSAARVVWEGSTYDATVGEMRPDFKRKYLITNARMEDGWDFKIFEGENICGLFFKLEIERKKWFFNNVVNFRGIKYWYWIRSVTCLKATCEFIISDQRFMSYGRWNLLSHDFRMIELIKSREWSNWKQHFSLISSSFQNATRLLSDFHPRHKFQFLLPCSVNISSLPASSLRLLNRLKEYEQKNVENQRQACFCTSNIKCAVINIMRWT